LADIKWIKIVVDIFDDEKIFLIEQLPDADSIIVIWFKLLCLAGKQNNKGVFTINDVIPYTDEMFAAVFRRPINTVRLALSTFEKYGMIAIVNGTVTILNWAKHQNIEGMEKRQAYMREYMRNYRAEQKAIADGKHSCKHLHKHLCKQNVSAPDKDKDKDRDIDNKNIYIAPPDNSGVALNEGKEEISIFSLVLNDGSQHRVMQSEFDRYKELYPAVDVMQELRGMAGWLEANPTKRKTRNGIRRFINFWLSKRQDSSGGNRAYHQQPQQQYKTEPLTGNPFRR
jgi:predicted phage replisome organizer